MRTYLAQARFMANALLDGLQPFVTFGDCVTHLRAKLKKKREGMPVRLYRYFAREVSEQLVMSRTLHYIVQLYRKKDTVTCMPDLALLEGNDRLHPALFEKLGPVDDECETVRRLLSGSHLSEIVHPKVSSHTVSCAVELFPLDTLQWIVMRRPQWLTPQFVQRTAVRVACGLNPSDIEQFNIFRISECLPMDMRLPFRALVVTAARKNRYAFLARYEKFLRLPLGSVEKEMRRIVNFAKYLGR